MSDPQQFIGRLSRLGKKILPDTASLWLYGSRARKTAREDSDWDLLILLDEEKQKSTDFAQYAYPFTLMASAEDQMVIPQIYTKKQWRQMHFTPFVKNVEQDKIVLV
ncbi:MAG: nucleotidyltransferase domain-containing protein [Paludibacteraceae bacterium]|nr:nucleotidyltransferase domain-containing protein [Paludibacteraceae bacterium]